MTAPVIEGGVWHAPVNGLLMPCASFALAESVLEVHKKNSTYVPREHPPAPEPVDEYEPTDDESEPMQECLYYQCDRKRVKDPLHGFGFCEWHLKQAARYLGWPKESLLEQTEKEPS